MPEGSLHDEVFIDADGRIRRIEHRPRTATAPRRSPLTAIGAYLFSTEFLAAHAGSGPAATADFARDFVPAAVPSARVYGYVCDTPERPCYWRTVSSVDSYWQAHMELTDDLAPTFCAQDSWPIFTRQEPLAPPRVLRSAYVDSAILSPGCVVAGAVTHSVVSTRCRVGANAVVHDSILLPGAVVGDGCVLDRVIVDCDTRLAPKTILGARLGSDSRFYASPGGVVLAAAHPQAPSPPTARAIA